ncbi:hypothetical protein ACYPKM_02605 [Pseudomonas aeruginosa]
MTDTKDVSEVAKVIDEMAAELDHRAHQLRTMANSLRKEGNLDYAAEAAHTVMNIGNSLRVDLLFRRSMRVLGHK